MIVRSRISCRNEYITNYDDYDTFSEQVGSHFIFQSLDAGSLLPLQGVCDPVTGNTPLMYAAMENKVMVMMMVMMTMMLMLPNHGLLYAAMENKVNMAKLKPDCSF